MRLRSAKTGQPTFIPHLLPRCVLRLVKTRRATLIITRAMLWGNVLPAPPRSIPASGFLRGVLASWGIDMKSLLFGGSRLSTPRPRGMATFIIAPLTVAPVLFRGGTYEKTTGKATFIRYILPCWGDKLSPNEARKPTRPPPAPAP